MPRRQSDELVPPIVEERVSGNNEHVGPLLNKPCKSSLEIGLTGSLERPELHRDCLCGLFHHASLETGNWTSGVYKQRNPPSTPSCARQRALQSDATLPTWTPHSRPAPERPPPAIGRPGAICA